MRNLKIDDAGSVILSGNGSDTVVLTERGGGPYFVFATNGDWDAAPVKIIATSINNGKINLQLDKAYSGTIRVNYAICTVTQS